MAKTKFEKIPSIKEKIKQLENKKSGSSSAWGFIEKLLPGTIPLTEEQFKGRGFPPSTARFPARNPPPGTG